MIFALIQGRQETIKDQLANQITSDPSQDQWLRGQYYAYGDLLATTYEETKSAD